jgi:hypothetical protein
MARYTQKDDTYDKAVDEILLNTYTIIDDQYNITFEGRSRIFVDGANPFFIRALKDRVDEKQIYYYKKQYPSVYDLQFLQRTCLSFQSLSRKNISTY